MPPNPSVGDWRLVFARTDTDATIASFECEISKLGRFVSPKVGSMEARIPIPSEQVGLQAYKVFGGEGKLSMYAYRGNVIWWGGFLDSLDIDSGPAGSNVPELIVTGASFEAYPNRREARTDEALVMEQTHFAKWFWDYMQKERGGNILVETPTPPASGRTRQMSWKRAEAKKVGAILKEISNRVDGFEWIIDCFEDGAGMRRRELVTGYPTIGRPDMGHVLTYPGNVLTYRIVCEALDGATSFQARGKAPDPIGTPGTPGNTDGSGGSGSPAVKQDPIMSEVFTADDWITAGYTLTDATIDRDTVTDVSTLNEWAKLARDMRSGPLVLPQLTCRMDGFNHAILGATVQVMIRDYPFPTGPNGEPGWRGSARVIGYEIDPGEFGGEDIIRLIFEDPRDDDNMKRNPL